MFDIYIFYPDGKNVYKNVKSYVKPMIDLLNFTDSDGIEHSTNLSFEIVKHKEQK